MISKQEELLVYQPTNGTAAVNVRLEDETVWLTQSQMVILFKKTKQNSSLHIRNVFKEGELPEAAVVKESLTTAAFISRSIQLIAGRTAQEYTNRKKRKGAFWEDLHHATAVDTDDHFIRCLMYIDLNMVRAGVVKHPSEWKHGGYHEIIDPVQRYRIIAETDL